MDPRNRFRTPCKPIFAINPKITRIPGAEITHALSQNAIATKYCIVISVPEGRKIFGFMSKIVLHGGVKTISGAHFVLKQLVSKLKFS